MGWRSIPGCRSVGTSSACAAILVLGLSCTGPTPPSLIITTQDDLPRGTFDDAALGAFLTQLGLEAPEQPFPAVDVGLGRSFERALADLAEGGATSAEAFGAVGMHLLKVELLVAADRCFQQAAEQDPGDYRWRHYRGDVAQRREEVSSALGYFGAAIELDPQAPAPRLRRARMLRDADDDGAAELDLRAALEGDPSSIVARLDLATLLLDRDDGTAAQPLLEQVLEQRPDQPSAHALLARLFRERGDVERAAAHQRRIGQGVPLGDVGKDPLLFAVEQRTQSLEYLEALAHQQMQARDWSALARTTAQLYEREPTAAWGARYAEALLFNGQVDAARGTAEDVLSRGGSNGLAHQVLARLALRSGDVAAAVRHAGAALESDPGDRVALETRIRARAQSGQFESALQDVTSLRGLDPSHHGAYLLEATVHHFWSAAAPDDGRRQTRLEQARRAAGMALARKPADARIEAFVDRLEAELRAASGS